MQEGDGDEMLCHLKQRNASPGAIFAKVINEIHCDGFKLNKFYVFLETLVIRWM